MELLLSCLGLGKYIGSRQLFRGVSFQVSDEDRLGVIGENGSGKSTLLSLLAQKTSPDEGEISYKKGIHIAYVEQNNLLIETDTVLQYLEKEASQARFLCYDATTEAKIMLGKLGIKNPQTLIKELSGGWQKRLQIGGALIQKPDLILLDEPTNHLDIEGILWLEELLLRERFPLVVVTHDRSFLQKVTNKTLEISANYPQGFFCCQESYQKFVEKRQDLLHSLQKQHSDLYQMWRKELTWLHRSPPARTTKARARQKGVESLAKELETFTSAPEKKQSLSFESTGKKNKKLITAKGIGKAYQDRVLFKDFDVVLERGTRWGILGPNGSGKTTLLKVLGHYLEPDQGSVRLAEDLKICYFDQKKENLPLDKRLKDFLSPQSDFVFYQQSNMHVSKLAQHFYLPEDKLFLPIEYLSGGQKSRLLLARLMIQQADVLLLDEPTNDLDLLSLSLLEESLQSFPGAVLLVSHDRSMLQRVCSHLISVNEKGEVSHHQYYEDWEEELFKQKEPVKEKKIKEDPVLSLPKKKNLSWNEKQELEKLPQSIENNDYQLRQCQEELQSLSPQSDRGLFEKICSQLQKLEDEQERLFQRWELLESKQRGL